MTLESLETMERATMSHVNSKSHARSINTAAWAGRTMDKASQLTTVYKWQFAPSPGHHDPARGPAPLRENVRRVEGLCRIFKRSLVVGGTQGRAEGPPTSTLQGLPTRAEAEEVRVRSRSRNRSTRLRR